MAVRISRKINAQQHLIGTEARNLSAGHSNKVSLMDDALPSEPIRNPLGERAIVDLDIGQDMKLLGTWSTLRIVSLDIGHALKICRRRLGLEPRKDCGRGRWFGAADDHRVRGDLKGVSEDVTLL